MEVRPRNTPAPTPAPDRTTLESLFNAHHEQVFMAAYRVCGNVDDAEDVLQTVFLRFIKRNDNGGDGRVCDGADHKGFREKVFGNDPARYLCKAAINAGLDVLRGKQRHAWISLEDENHSDDDIASSYPAADQDVQQRQWRRRLRLALLQLHPRAAEIFALRYFEDLNNAQIAELLGTSISGVAVTLHRSRQRLQELLHEFDGSF